MFDADRFQSAIEVGFAGRPEDALRELAALRQETPDDDERGWILIYEARFLGHLLRVREARDRLTELRSIKPWTDKPEYRARVELADAVLHEAEGDPKRTLTELNQILKQFAPWWSDPEWEDIYEELQANRGRLLTYQGHWREAIPLLEFIANSRRGKPGEFYFNLGSSYFETGQRDKAERWLRDALTKNDLDDGRIAASHFYLGHIEFKRTAYGKSLIEFEAAYEHAVESEWRTKIAEALVAVCDRLHLADEAQKYKKLAQRQA